MHILESIFYILSNILLIFSFIIIKKSNEKMNIVHWIFISLILLFCYNSIIVFMLSSLNIPSYLYILGIINSCLSGILLKKFKNKKQEYYCKKSDIIATIVIALITLGVMIARFGLPFNIAYESCDPAIHFWTAKDFYEQSYLLNKVTDKTIVNFETRLTGSYTNLGLIFKVVSPLMNDFDLYIIYILFDIWMIFLSGMLFYILISNTKNKTTFIISLICTIMYFLGYPLNNVIFGFFYSGHAVTIINLILILSKYLYDKKFNKNILIIMFSIIMFGLFFTYYFYAPVVFISLF